MTDPDLHRFPVTPNLTVCVDSSCCIVLQVGGLSTTYQRITITSLAALTDALEASRVFVNRELYGTNREGIAR